MHNDDDGGYDDDEQQQHSDDDPSNHHQDRSLDGSDHRRRPCCHDKITVRDHVDENDDDDDCHVVFLPTSLSSSSTTTTTKTTTTTNYDSRKPKWWKTLSGRNTTKGQKRAIHHVLDIHKLRLPTVQYGTVLDWNNVFGRNHDDVNYDSDRTNGTEFDIWLELGFGRGENLLALAHRKEEEEQQSQHLDGSIIRLVGAEIHTPGIGILCQRIQQAWQKNSNNDDEGRYWEDYTLYSPNLDPFVRTTTAGMDTTDASDTTSDDVDENINIGTPLPPDNNDDYWAMAIEYDKRRTDQQQQQQQQHQQQKQQRKQSFSYTNLRIHAGDGVKLLPKIPTNSIAVVIVTFPDPFPKQDETRWRLIQVHTMLEIYRILRKKKDNGPQQQQQHQQQKDDEEDSTNSSSTSSGLFYLATDHDGYYEWVHHIIQQVNDEGIVDHNDTTTLGSDGTAQQQQQQQKKRPLFQSVVPCPDRLEWLPAISTYEQKGWDEGRSTKLACWRVCCD